MHRSRGSAEKRGEGTPYSYTYRIIKYSDYEVFGTVNHYNSKGQRIAKTETGWFGEKKTKWK